MRILNNKNPELAMCLIPWFIPTNQNPIDMSWQLHERLRENPDDTLCLIAVENSIIQAILIAYIQKRNVWLWQAHSRKGFRFPRLMFDLLKNWSKARKRKKIRMGTYQKKDSIQKRWGFKSCRWNTNIMEYKL